MASQYVGIDLHRRRSVIVRQTPDGQVVDTVRIDNDPVALSCAVAEAGPDPEVVIEATYGWYWAVDVLEACGATVHLAHPLGVKAFAYRRVKNDVRDAGDLADLLRMGRLPEAWIAPPYLRQLRELVRYRAKLVALRSGLKAQVHAVLAKEGVAVRMSDLFGKDCCGVRPSARCSRTCYRLRTIPQQRHHPRGSVTTENGTWQRVQRTQKWSPRPCARSSPIPTRSPRGHICGRSPTPSRRGSPRSPSCCSRQRSTSPPTPTSHGASPQDRQYQPAGTGPQGDQAPVQRRGDPSRRRGHQAGRRGVARGR